MIMAYYDDPYTPGFDYVPSTKFVVMPLRNVTKIIVKLIDGASIFLDGDVLFFEASTIYDSTYTLISQDSGDVIQLNENVLKYGTNENTLSSYLGLPSNVLIIPVNIKAKIKGVLTINMNGKPLQREFIIEDQTNFTLQKGEYISIDQSKLTLQLSLSKIKVDFKQIGDLVTNKEKEGFYIAVERQKVAISESLIHEAEIYFNQDSYQNSFMKLREAYFQISNIKNWLSNMTIEVNRSIFILLPLFALSAISISFFLFEKKFHKLLGTVISYIILLFSLYLMHPGIKILDRTVLIGFSLFSLFICLGFILFLQIILKGKKAHGRVAFRNIIIPILSISKRSLRRRQLRLILTLTSVFLIVSSFVALTSFTVDFGLAFGRVSKEIIPSRGLLVRSPNSPVVEAISPLSGGAGMSWYQPLEESFVEWFKAQSDIIKVAPKYDTSPCRQYSGANYPLGYLNKIPIFGVTGIVPSMEEEIFSLKKTVIEGRYLQDDEENGIIVSEILKDKLNVNVNDVVQFRVMDKVLSLKIIGVLDDNLIEAIKDFDGQSILPKKIIELWRVNEVIMEGFASCLANEIIITNLKMMPQITNMQLSRLDIIPDIDKDLRSYAKRITLNKGLKVWASTEDGLYLTQLTSFFEGKGLPILIPWLIVVLIVIVTILNSFNERKKEIVIYSSIGMNPLHITIIFLVEAAIIGIIGGAVGYLLGLFSYKIIYILTPSLQVKQKISAFWIMATLGISFVAVITGGLIALKYSIAITPSLKRRWRIKYFKNNSSKPFELKFPIQINETELKEFTDYILTSLKLKTRACKKIYNPKFIISNININSKEKNNELIIIINFTYSSADSMVRGIYIRNKLILKKEKSNSSYIMLLINKEKENDLQTVGSFIRNIILEWSIRAPER